MSNARNLGELLDVNGKIDAESPVAIGSASISAVATGTAMAGTLTYFV